MAEFRMPERRTLAIIGAVVATILIVVLASTLFSSSSDVTPPEPTSTTTTTTTTTTTAPTTKPPTPTPKPTTKPPQPTPKPTTKPPAPTPAPAPTPKPELVDKELTKVAKRCDGSTELFRELEELKIGPCLPGNDESERPCTLKQSNGKIKFSVKFMSLQKFDRASVSFSWLATEVKKDNACDLGLKCPTKEANIHQVLEWDTSDGATELKTGKGDMRIEVNSDSESNKSAPIFCAEFPMNVVE